MEDPEQFYKDNRGKRIVLDEIHVLANPSSALKIAADHFPDIKIVATGSSTLAASKKFKDTLTGRKNCIHLTPMLISEGTLFGNDSLDHRMQFGGLPPFFLSKEFPEHRYNEWLISYFARDIQELYKVEKRYEFIKFIKLILSQSGGIFEATRFAHECEVSRPTIAKYLDIAEQTYVAKIIRPLSKRSSQEIISAPKVYGFDTGFICFAKSWDTVRHEQVEYLWEHIVLNNLTGIFQNKEIKYWRTKSGLEIDFVIKNKQEQIAIECKWSSRNFNAKNILAFRRNYPGKPNYVVSSDVIESFTRVVEGITITYVSLENLIKLL